MQIAMRCEKCGNMFMNTEDDLCLQFDFFDKKISYICRNKKCNHDNVFDFGDWKKKQEHSPLPRMGVL